MPQTLVNSLDLDNLSFEKAAALVEQRRLEKRSANIGEMAGGVWDWLKEHPDVSVPVAGAGAGGLAGLASSYMEPEGRRNTLNRMLTGATIGGLTGFGGRELYKNLPSGEKSTEPAAEPPTPREAAQAELTAAQKAEAAVGLMPRVVNTAKSYAPLAGTATGLVVGDQIDRNRVWRAVRDDARARTFTGPASGGDPKEFSEKVDKEAIKDLGPAEQAAARNAAKNKWEGISKGLTPEQARTNMAVDEGRLYDLLRSKKFTVPGTNVNPLQANRTPGSLDWTALRDRWMPSRSIQRKAYELAASGHAPQGTVPNFPVTESEFRHATPNVLNTEGNVLLRGASSRPGTISGAQALREAIPNESFRVRHGGRIAGGLSGMAAGFAIPEIMRAIWGSSSPALTRLSKAEQALESLKQQ